MNDYASDIKSLVTMPELLNYYGFEPNRAGYICCPFHSEKTASFKVYKDTGHCFGCGEHHDVISFVEKYFNLDFMGAIKKINEDFNLMLPIGENLTLTQRFEAEKAMQEHRRAVEQRKNEREAVKERYNRYLDEFTRLEKQRKEYAPTAKFQEPCKEFLEAVKKIDGVKFLLEQAEIELNRLK